MSSLSSLKKASLIGLLIFLAGCQSLRTREDIRKTPTPQRPSVPGQTTTTSPPPQAGQPPLPDPEDEDMVEVVTPPPPAPVIPSMPRIGVILGAGGARTYAHIGFLHELAKAKVPVTAIAGVEFAAPMAALYAHKEQANEVEWQMFKLKDEDVVKKSLLGGVNKNAEATVLRDFLNTAFARAKAEDFKIPFTCPSYNLKKNQVYMMNRGGMVQLVSSCMAYPPYFRPYEGTISAVREITATANYLRTKGANYIVLVNVLHPPGGRPYTLDAAATDNVLWSEIGGLYNKPFAGVDSVVSLDAGNYGIMDFDRRREIMNKGAESAAKQLKTLTRKWGL